MSWQPTVGTLNDEDLYLAKITIAALGYDDVVAHIDALTAQLERARGIAVRLENELAERDAYAAYPQRYVMPMVEPTEAQIAEMQRGAGTWPMRQYATVELPDEVGTPQVADAGTGTSHRPDADKTVVWDGRTDQTCGRCGAQRCTKAYEDGRIWHDTGWEMADDEISWRSVPECPGEVATTDQPALDERAEELINEAMSTGQVMTWAEAWVQTVRDNPALLDGDDNNLAGWMLTWFANVQESCRHNRAESAAALADFKARNPDLFATVELPDDAVDKAGDE